MPAEPRHEQVMAAIRTGLSVTGAAYWYAPDRVIRAASLHEGCIAPGTSGETISCTYVIVPDQTVRKSRVSKMNEARAEFDVFGLQRLPAGYSDLNPQKMAAEGATVRETYQARLAADIEAKLLALVGSETMRGLGVYEIVCTSDDRTAETTAIEGWALALLRVAVSYTYPRATP
jgi:hypothetical protein